MPFSDGILPLSMETGGFLVVDFLALKYLAGSDLGWFRSLYRVHANTNLKGINLNANPLTTVFYRDLQVVADSQDGRVPVTATLLGPNGAGPYTGTFKIIRGEAYKNWRFNGTLVEDPVDEPNRFSGLLPGDIAILGFKGRPVPSHVDVILLSQEASRDKDLFRYFTSLIPKNSGGRSMFELGTEMISDALEKFPGLEDHPLSQIVVSLRDDEVLEDVALGGSSGLTYRMLPKHRKVSAADILMRRSIADRIGREGEALFDAFLQDLGVSYEWTSEPKYGDGFAPFDFEIFTGNLFGRVDVKTTDGPFERPIHLSFGELCEAGQSEAPYRIGRIYHLKEKNAKLRISGDISKFASEVIQNHNHAFPEGIKADAFTVSVNSTGLIWGPEIILRPVDDEEQ